MRMTAAGKFGGTARAWRPELAVIVSTFERPQHLRRCLESIAAQTEVAERIEVIITDDGSSDLTLAMVAAFAGRTAFRVAFTTHEHDGFRLSQCRNEGAAVARADRLLFTDGDCLLPPGSLARYLAAIRPSRITAGDSCRLDEAATAALTLDDIRTGRFVAAVAPEERRRLAAKAVHSKIYEMLRVPMRPRVYGNAIGITRADYEKLNGFDEAFVGWGLEDRDLQRRAEAFGIRAMGMFAHAFVHQWHPVAPSFVRNAVGTENERLFHRRRIEPACREGFAARAETTMPAFDSRPALLPFEARPALRRVA
jgi:glycosyltransferase involved in cell wall biosynthesis